MNASLSEEEKKVLTAVQEDFPLAERPFLEIAIRLGMKEDEVIMKIKHLRESGMIRKFGAVLNPKELGYVSLLAAASISDDKVDSVSNIINEFPGVTHNYLRQGQPNIWFTLTESNMELLEANLKKIQERTGIRVIRMPMTKKYKIGVKLDI